MNTMLCNKIALATVSWKFFTGSFIQGKISGCVQSLQCT